jgi:hypothetical protein
MDWWDLLEKKAIAGDSTLHGAAIGNPASGVWAGS